MDEPQAWVICSCCGASIPDTEDDNVDHESRGQDEGFGMCAPCAEWAVESFYTPRIKRLAEALNDENRAKFLALDRHKQEAMVARAVEKGLMI